MKKTPKTQGQRKEGVICAIPAHRGLKRIIYKIKMAVGNAALPPPKLKGRVE